MSAINSIYNPLSSEYGSPYEWLYIFQNWMYDIHYRQARQKYGSMDVYTIQNHLKIASKARQKY
ncbi:MAG: hypothetical protein R6U30_07715, partial [Halomonas sp.]|uniref:hypothetical protein n=1 Tax=Halomonas sp. TaxID=1486246 RepID=UPI003970DE23